MHKIAVIYAMEGEISKLKKSLSQYTAQVLFIRTGIGKKPTVKKIRKIVGNELPEIIISVGFGGALSRELRVGDVIVCNQVLNKDSADIILKFPSELLEIFDSLGIQDFYKLLTVDELVEKASDKVKLNEQTEAKVCDMETYHVISGIQNKTEGHLFIPIRIISDDANADLPDIKGLVNKDFSINFWKLLKRIFTKPSSIIKLIRFNLNLGKAQKKLTNFVSELIKQILAFNTQSAEDLEN